MYVCVFSLHTRTSKKKSVSWKRSLISESETRILYRFIAHRVKYFKPLFLEILMNMAYRKLKPKIQCLRKFEYYIKSIKKDILKRNVRLLKSMFISMHSINVAWHGGSLWHCSGVMEAQVALIVAFRSSALLGLGSLIFLLRIPHRFSM